MSLKSIYYSINHILKNKNINKATALLKYIEWQLIKMCNRFPIKIKISESIIEIQDKKIALEGGTKMYTQQMYDYNNMNLIKYILNINPSTFFDIGTNIGVYTLIASESKESQIFCFEPHPYTFNILNYQISLNQRNNIHAYNKAISNTTGKVTFTNVNGSSINKIVTGINQNTIEVDAITINDFCNENNIIPDIVKIDVEGFELEVLNGFQEKLKNIKILFIEITKNHCEVHQLLLQNNLIGPFSYSSKNKTISVFNSTHSIEDPIYIHKDFQLVLSSLYSISFNES